MAPMCGRRWPIWPRTRTCRATFSDSSAGFSHAHIERAGTAMADRGLGEADHERPKAWKRKPLRHLAPQDAALFFAVRLAARRPALAGDDEHQAVAAGLRRS